MASLLCMRDAQPATTPSATARTVARRLCDVTRNKQNKRCRRRYFISSADEIVSNGAKTLTEVRDLKRVAQEGKNFVVRCFTTNVQHSGSTAVHVSFQRVYVASRQARTHALYFCCVSRQETPHCRRIVIYLEMRFVFVLVCEV